MNTVSRALSPTSSAWFSIKKLHYKPLIGLLVTIEIHKQLKPIIGIWFDTRLIPSLGQSQGPSGDLLKKLEDAISRGDHK